MNQETTNEQIKNLLKKQRLFFATNKTKEINFRVEQLKRLEEAINKYEKSLTDALFVDLHKSYEESYLTEIGVIKNELKNHIKHVRKWSKTRKVKTPVHLFPSKSYIKYEPFGVSLIVAPWNYPVQLLINPLIGAISAGCCAILKPSPYTPNVAKVLIQMINETFPEEYVGITFGGRDVNKMLLEQHFDMIFFTGSPQLGKIVMMEASKNLTPVVLELGGKSPCIVDKDADINIAAKRIVWGKMINAGQTCIAPDYLFVHSSVKKELLEKMIENIKSMYGENHKESVYFPRIVNDKAMERLTKLLKDGEIIYGGDIDFEERYISPTIIDNVEEDFPIMKEEIFGPILPVLTFENINDVLEYVNNHEKPLAFYYFGKNKKAWEILDKSTSGGACINDTLMHFTNDNLPFGGVGNSGMGKYHGFESFKAFSNMRGIVKTTTKINISQKYAPYKQFNMIKKIF
ncbi:aldehyde dehydrogenase [Bacteroidales bacterium OttesenSCG-928-K03]|nr:aldehyde dehydrogenase [Odoribacter sp. OttesenSCG-928-L07]MDL2238790.1 aldehyde dehydrogenase [Bacteroidales bacterium OttesenSCG-928-L14]MDL2242169.1 aldehyde dehydrogenase [Bacteroidales bacterium OttesenSCG-928-K03]